MPEFKIQLYRLTSSVTLNKPCLLSEPISLICKSELKYWYLTCRCEGRMRVFCKPWSTLHTLSLLFLLRLMRSLLYVLSAYLFALCMLYMIFLWMLYVSHSQLMVQGGCAADSLTWSTTWPGVLTGLPPFWFSAVMSFRIGRYMEAKEVGPHCGIHRLGRSMLRAHSKFGSRHLDFFP